tara:strand:- start:509 stop:958 length:450 start_codon:yes stop_codon:yes gene_type:complete
MKKNLIGQQKHINKLPNYIYMTTNYIDKKNDMVLYRGDNGEVKSMGYTINSVLPHLNIPAMKGGGKIPGKKSKEGQYVIPAGLALLNQAIVDREKQNDLFQSYISQDEGATMLPEEIEKHFFNRDKSNTNRKTRKYKRSSKRTTRKRNR